MEKIIDAMIEEVYNSWAQSGNYTDFPDTKKASGDIYSIFRDNPVFEDIKLELESAISQSGIEYEKQGFIYGFKKAMELFTGEVM